MSYNADSIQIKDFRNACRSTPGMYIGTDGQDAAFNCFLEALNNACDEATMGRGNEIKIIVSDDGDTITCIDKGRGVPHGANKDCKEVLIELFTAAHSSGKFDTTNYKKVRGCHGIGMSAVCVCSTKFEVWSRREGAEYYLSFKDGIPEAEEAKLIRNTDETGSTFTFTPDKKIFNITEESFNIQRIRDELEITSYFFPNVKFILEHKGKKEVFVSKNGLKDFAKDKIKKPLHKSYIYGYKEFNDEVEVEVFAQWTDGKEQRFIFSNGALNKDGGTPETGAKTAFTRTINSLSKGEFDADMIRKGLVYIVNIKHPHPIYENQTKNRIQNNELRGYTQTVFTEAIKEFVLKHKDEFDKIVDILTKEKKAEAAAEKARQAVLNMEKETENAGKKKFIESSKLNDARTLGENSILLLVEGKSAGGTVQRVRDVDNYGILKLRGKIINALSNDLDDVLKNEEVSLFLKATGININNYAKSKLRYGKVGICVDADDDGMHIACLIIAMLYKLAPQFLKENRLCWLHAPLFKITKGKTVHFYYREEDLPKTVDGIQTRFKGLGEMNDSDAAAMFGPEQWLETLEWSDEAALSIEQLMGEDSEPKKEFIFNNIDFEKYGEV